MVGLPLWAVFAVAFGSPLLAFLGVVTAQWFARMSDRELEDRSRREETMRTLRWAAELSASEDDALSDLGRSQLLTLTRSELVGRDELAFVVAAMESRVAASREAFRSSRGRRMHPPAHEDGEPR